MDTNTTVVISDSGTVAFSTPNVITVTQEPTSNIVISDNSQTIVALLKETDTVTSGGASGPPGPPGILEDDIMYSKRVDFISDEILYRGEAPVGSLETASVWRIRIVTIASSDGDVSETWASGTAEFDKIWSDRATYVYS